MLTWIEYERQNLPPAPPPQAQLVPQPELIRRPAAPAPRSSAWVWAAVAATLLLIGAFLVYSFWPQQNWEQANRSQIIALKSEAQQLATDGKLREAHARYQQLESLVAGHNITDPLLQEQVIAAQREQQQVFLSLLPKAASPVENRAVVPQSQPVAPLATTQDHPSPPPKALEQVTPVLPAPPATQEVAITPPMIPPPPATQLAIVTPPTPPPPLVAGPPRRVLPRRPPVEPIPIRWRGVTDEQIGAGIEQRVDVILAQFQDGQLKGEQGRGQYAGLNALCVYALLQAGQAIDDERLNIRAAGMKLMVNKMREMPIRGSADTYSRAIRATALALYNRPEDRTALKADVAWLLKATNKGGYTYSDTGGGWDNSNSQYGLLGAWSAAEVGIEVPDTYWKAVQSHWFDCQNADGSWGYHSAGASGTLSMSSAGLASLFVTHDWLEAPSYGTAVGRPPFSKPLERGLAWIETGDNCLNINSGMSTGYTLYGIERVGLASGFKYFGRHDWYRELAAGVLGAEEERGQWFMRRRMGGNLVEMCYSLLFLAHGRHPVMMNKLRFDGFWANRPRDVANLRATPAGSSSGRSTGRWCRSRATGRTGWTARSSISPRIRP